VPRKAKFADKDDAAIFRLFFKEWLYSKNDYTRARPR
jgi:hypothetical protein